MDIIGFLHKSPIRNKKDCFFKFFGKGGGTRTHILRIYFDTALAVLETVLQPIEAHPLAEWVGFEPT